MSLPTRGAWIEIYDVASAIKAYMVAPHAGSVDRNPLPAFHTARSTRVAPHAGSVDRNISLWDAYQEMQAVAPHAGSVDRNIVLCVAKVQM